MLGAGVSKGFDPCVRNLKIDQETDRKLISFRCCKNPAAFDCRGIAAKHVNSIEISCINAQSESAIAIVGESFLSVQLIA